ncbi:MAG: LysR family transcriptional regulator [Phenylobacterium sp.]|jgi:DNA-binding transcriptional LysR family regulator
MSKLPDLEGLAVFSRVAELRSFTAAAASLGVSKATASKAVSRLEARLGTQLIHRTPRRFSLTDAGRSLAEAAASMLATAEAAEAGALDQAVRPWGRIRMSAPMSYGLDHLAHLLPDFLSAHPGISIDLQLSDEVVDLVGEGFDCALRIAVLPDSRLTARKLRPVQLRLVGSPAYLGRRGRPERPEDLEAHDCLGYAHRGEGQIWRFTGPGGEERVQRPRGPLTANNADALRASLLAGLGLAVLPDFVVDEDIAAGRLDPVMTDWSAPEIGMHIVTPGGGPRPARVMALIQFLTRRLGRPLQPRTVGA